MTNQIHGFASVQYCSVGARIPSRPNQGSGHETTYFAPGPRYARWGGARVYNIVHAVQLTLIFVVFELVPSTCRLDGVSRSVLMDGDGYDSDDSLSLFEGLEPVEVSKLASVDETRLCIIYNVYFRKFHNL